MYFALWRAAYDVGLGWVLTKQSKKKWIVREVHKLGWLDQARKPNVRAWIKKQLAGKMGKDYHFDVSSQCVEGCHTTTQCVPIRISRWSIILGYCLDKLWILFCLSTLHFLFFSSTRNGRGVLSSGAKITAYSYSDFVAYCMFAFSCFRVPTNLSIWVHIMRYAVIIPMLFVCCSQCDIQIDLDGSVAYH